MKIQIFISLSILFLHSLAQTPLTLNETTEANTLTARSKANYIFQIPNDVVGKESYLVFDVTGTKDSISDPDIFISNVLLLYHLIDIYKSNVNQ